MPHHHVKFNTVRSELPQYFVTVENMTILSGYGPEGRESSSALPSLLHHPSRLGSNAAAASSIAFLRFIIFLLFRQQKFICIYPSSPTLNTVSSSLPASLIPPLPSWLPRSTPFLLYTPLWILLLASLVSSDHVQASCPALQFPSQLFLLLQSSLLLHHPSFLVPASVAHLSVFHTNTFGPPSTWNTLPELPQMATTFYSYFYLSSGPTVTVVPTRNQPVNIG